jgi:hypothetical protein
MRGSAVSPSRCVRTVRRRLLVVHLGGLALITCPMLVLAHSAALALATTGFTSLMTGEATNVGPRSATLHGSFMSASDEETSYWFEYHPCESTEVCYSTWAKTPEAVLTQGQIKAAEDASRGAGVDVESATTGLNAGTFYSYRLVVKASMLTMDAGQGRFMTGPKAPRVGSETTFEVTASTAVLVATLNPGNSAGSNYPTTYHFDYERVGSGELQSFGPAGVVADSGTVATVPEELTGLTPESEYAYWLVAEDASGEGEGEQQKFTSAVAPAGELQSAGSPPVVGPGIVQPPTLGLLPTLAPVAVPKSLAMAAGPETKAHKLSQSLAACRKDKSKSKRARCKRQARSKYGAKVAK